MAILGGLLKVKGCSADEAKMLDSLQAHTLTGHVRDRMVVLLFQFDQGAEAARTFVSSVAQRVKSMAQQLDEREKFHDDGVQGRPYVGFGLSATGYRKLGIDADRTPRDPAFRAGMRAAADRLNDDPSQWHVSYQERIDAVVILADARGRDLTPPRKEIERWAVGCARLIRTERGDKLINSPTEAFGFVDGLSQPVFLQEDLHKLAGQNGFQHWDPGFPLKTILVKDPGVSDRSTAKLAFGTYLVYRKLRQDVSAFTGYVEKTTALGDNGEAFVVGRSRVGWALGATNIPVPPPTSPSTNDFDYANDGEGLRCPLNAHVRVMNPRTTADRAHVIARRGQAYGPDWRLHALGIAGAVGDVTEAGLLFMAMNANIRRQFEFLQRQANARVLGQPVRDDLVGQGRRVRRRYPDENGTRLGRRLKDAPPDAVTMRGGEYFFLPSLPFLLSVKP